MASVASQSSFGMPWRQVRRIGRLDQLLVLILLVVLVLLAGLSIGAPRRIELTVDASRVALSTGGLHAREYFPIGGGSYRWSSGSAWILLPNPGGTWQVTFSLAGNPERSVDIVIAEGARRFGFRVEPNIRHYTLLLPPTARTQPVFTIEAPTLYEPPEPPAEVGRELGVVLVRIGLRGAGTMALETMLWLAAMVVVLYGSLRYVGRGPLLAAGITGVALLGAVGWYAGGAWPYIVLNVVASALAGALLLAIGIHWMIVRWPLQHITRRLLPLALLLALLVYTAGIAVYLIFPGIEDTLLREDAIIEQGTAFLFLVGTVLALGLLVLSVGVRLRLLLAIGAVGGLAMLLSEISFGGRLIDLPVIILFGVPFDGFHDLIGVAINAFLAADTRSRLLLIGALLIVPALLLLLLYPQRQRWLAEARRLLAAPYIPLAIVTLIFLVLGVVLDGTLWHTRFLQLMEELSDLNAALAFIALLLSIWCSETVAREADAATPMPQHQQRLAI
ncbi:MAG TPA: hypothetical protein PKA05_01365 [Roseiflexaceae bacterium]|nr:hypothetical protein [Roseiflexaceae bacterium]